MIYKYLPHFYLSCLVSARKEFGIRADLGCETWGLFAGEDEES